MFHHEDWYYHDLYDGITITEAKGIKGKFKLEYYLYYRWKGRDQAIFEIKQEHIDKVKLLNEQPYLPRIVCRYCGRPMYYKQTTVVDGKALFFFVCVLGHLPKRAFFSNGNEFINDEVRCKKCQSEELTNKIRRTKKGFVISETCNDCSNVKLYSAAREEREPVTEKDRKKYCFTDEEAKKTEVHFWEVFMQELIQLRDIIKGDPKVYKEMMKKKD